MLSIYRFFFPSKPDGTAISLMLLVLRIFFGGLLLVHGIQKLNNFADLSAVFPDPLGVGSRISLMLAIFGEIACSIGFILGALYRLALIPMIFTMGMAFFIIHGNDAFVAKELAFIYFIVFILMYITGPGKFSIDRLISVPLSKQSR